MKIAPSTLRRCNQWFLLGIAFFLPLSTSAISILAVLLILGWSLEGRFAEKWQEIKENPVCLAVIAYVGMFAVGLLWSDHLAAGGALVLKQWKIALLPVFLTTISPDRRGPYVLALFAGLTCVLLLIFVAAWGVLPQAVLEYRWLQTPLKNHIVFTPMLALAIYWLIQQTLWVETVPWRRWGMLTLAGLMSCGVFMTIGRAGHVVFCVLMTLLVVQYYRKNLLRGAVVLLVLFPVVLGSAYALSPAFHDRVNLVASNLADYKENPDTSVGVRLLYWRNSWQIVQHSPWLGVGTGDFKSAYAQVNEQLSPSMHPTDNPHNQYLFVTTQLGIIGLASLLAIFVTQIVQAGRSADGWQRLRLAFPIFFLVIMLTESYLRTSSSGFFFSLVSAILYKRHQVRESEQTLSASAAQDPLAPAVSQ